MVDESRPDGEPTLREVFPFLFSESFTANEIAAPKPRPSRLAGAVPFIVVGAVVVLLILVMSVQDWSGVHQSGLARAVLRIPIIGGAVPVVIDVLALGALAFLLVRRPSKGRVIAASSGVVAGAALAIAALVYIADSNVLGVTLSAVSSAWIIAGFAGIGLAVASFWTFRGWRLLCVGGSIVVIAVAGTLGVNADFGLDPNVGALAGISTQRIITLPLATSTPTPVPTVRDGGALWANWTPPAGMPANGSMSQVIIPATISGFHARPAGLYLPPAALVPNPPKLPLVIMMMGQPGNPDPSFQGAILNVLASRHDGLAPIVLVADQIGNPAVDPLCTDDTRYGKAETYITQDVVNWARSHLNVLQDPAHWTIAGYSNGGECAFSFGAQFPNIWGNVLDISGELYPGSDDATATLRSVFRDNDAAYRAVWPQTYLLAHKYPNTDSIFTVSTNDPDYLWQARDAVGYAKAAGWQTTFYEILNGGHVLGALNGGLAEGYSVLYPRLGLSP